LLFQFCFGFFTHMNKRDFLRTGLLGAAGVALGTFTSSLQASEVMTTGFTLPPLPYPNNALEPYIDAMTMEIHHDKHHGAYVDKLNQALKLSPDLGKSIEQVLAEQAHVDDAIRNNGGGHYNHDLFWKTLSPKMGQNPGGKLLAALEAEYGSYDMFTKKFEAFGLSRFGSGWVWLCLDANQKIFITSTPNQDNPLMKLYGTEKGFPLFGLDVWEHAYYLKYQNKRKDYIDAFWKVLNWEFVEKRYAEATKM